MKNLHIFLLLDHIDNVENFCFLKTTQYIQHEVPNT